MPEEKLSGKTPVLHLWTRHSPPTTNFLSLSSLLISTLPFNTFPAALGGSAGQRHSLESLQSETWMLPSITALLIKPQAADLLKWLTKTIFKTKWKTLYQTIKAASRRSELRVISNLNTFPEHAGISETISLLTLFSFCALNKRIDKIFARKETITGCCWNAGGHVTETKTRVRQQTKP